MKLESFPLTRPEGQQLLMPLLEVNLRNGLKTETASGLLDSGAAVNVLPYDLGLKLGLKWEEAKKSLTLTGALANLEAKAVLLQGKVGNFPETPLVFAWCNSPVRLILGNVNFFDCFHFKLLRNEGRFELVLPQLD